MTGDASNQEHGIAQAHMHGAVDRMNTGDGLRRQSVANGTELSERGIGALAAVLVMVSLAALATDHSHLIIGACAAIALILCGIWLRRRSNIHRIREKQVRDLADSKN